MLNAAMQNSNLSEAERVAIQAQAQTRGLGAALGLLGGLVTAAAERARKQEERAEQVAQLKADVAKSGKIGASLDAAKEYIAQKEQEQAERDAASHAAQDAKIERMEADEAYAAYRAGFARIQVGANEIADEKRLDCHNPQPPKPAPSAAAWASFRAPEQASASLPPKEKPKPWWQRVGDWWQKNIAQPWQDFADRMVSAPNPKGALYSPSKANTLLTGTALLVDHFLFDGRLSRFAAQTRQAGETFLQQHPTIRTAWNLAQNAASFAHGFGAQVLDDFTFGLYGRLTHLNWENGSDAFQYGRRAGRVATQVAGQVELAAGAALALSSVSLIPPTSGAAAVCTAASGGLCLPLGGLAIAVEVSGVLAGAGLTAHGGAMLIRNAGNPVSGPAADPTLRYGSNTGNTTRNAQILRENMKDAGIEASGEAHHIVPSTSQNDAARQARDILEQWGIDINNADNGIFLPKSIHNGLANDHKYMNAVLEDLRQATSRDDTIRILQDIGQQLLDGTYPRSGR